MFGAVHLLGPQRPSPNLARVLGVIAPGKPVVTITAGWRHEEGDDDALRRDIGHQGQSLPLYRWFEELERAEPELFAAYRDRQEEILRIKRIYRIRLDAGILAASSLAEEHRKRPDETVAEELELAYAALRELRDRFVSRCDAVRQRFLAEWQPHEREIVRRKRDQAEQLLLSARAICIAGGHVGVLLNRMEFFGLAKVLRDAIEHGSHVVAWSGGAMAITDKVVLFHDDAAAGQPHAEVFDRGLGVADRIVALPHARERLRLDDPARVGLFANRFWPATCVGLEHGAWLVQRDGTWVNRGPRESAFTLEKDGTIRPLEVVDA